MKKNVVIVILTMFVLVTLCFGQQVQNVGITILAGVGWLNVNTTSSVTNGTTAPSEYEFVGGRTNDGTAQYQPIPEGTAGRSLIIEGVSGGTAVPVSVSTTTNPCVAPGATINGISGATSGTSAVQLIALSGATKIYVCSITVTGVSGTSPTFSLKYGTGTACASSGVTVWGPLTTTAATAFVMPSNSVVTPAGQALCYLDGGTSPVQNYAITYVQQ